MAHYRKIDVRIWNDAKFRSLTRDGQFVFFFILTHPNLTGLGAMRATLPGLAAELGWDTETLSKGFGELFRKGLVEFDERACFVGVPNFLKYNPPENPNVIKGWDKAVELLPECDLKIVAIQRVKEFAERFRKGSRKDSKKGLGNGMPNQEQKQEQNINLLTEDSAETAESVQSAETVLQFPIDGKSGKHWNLTTDRVADYEQAYPSLDIIGECRRALQWLRDNPTKRKTKTGMPAFLTRWLNKAQDSGRAAKPTGEVQTCQVPTDEDLKNWNPWA